MIMMMMMTRMTSIESRPVGQPFHPTLVVEHLERPLPAINPPYWSYGDPPPFQSYTLIMK